MDITGIKQLARQIDDSLVRGHIYHINYSVTRKKTDFYYSHARDLIKLLEDHRAEAIKSTDGPGADNPEQTYLGIIANFKHRLKSTPEYNALTDYNVDGIGFYIKQEHTWPGGKDDITTDGTTIYASDGKIMGIFYLRDSQAVLQPATERPPMVDPHWSDAAYLFNYGKISAAVNSMKTLKLTESGNELVITGEAPGEKKEVTQLEFHIDKSTLQPTEISETHYDTTGGLHAKLTKSWKYEDFAGINLPKLVVDREYEADFSKNLHLSEERTFTINDFSTTAKNAKEGFTELLKSNFSVYDEITGSHYLSGKPEEMLDKLSH